jgi:hypothetical protein
MGEVQPPEPRFQVLEHLHKTAASLQAFLRSRPPLTEAEQLFIENRIMMMQIEDLQAISIGPTAGAWPQGWRGNVFIERTAYRI